MRALSLFLCFTLGQLLCVSHTVFIIIFLISLIFSLRIFSYFLKHTNTTFYWVTLDGVGGNNTVQVFYEANTCSILYLLNIKIIKVVDINEDQNPGEATILATLPGNSTKDN